MIPVTNILVPVFFVVMGMLVDVTSMMNAIWFGLVISLLAILSKVFGSGIPALFSGFNLRGASRIGVGMMPRGEVALIIAGIGLTNGIIGQDLFGVSIMMTVITTLLAPIVLIPLFKPCFINSKFSSNEFEPVPRIKLSLCLLAPAFSINSFLSFKKI